MANPTKYLLKLAWLLKLAAQWGWYLLALFIIIVTQFPDWLASYYTNGLFKWFSKGLRWMSSSFPNAIGEYVYFFIFIILIINVFKHLFKYYNQYKIEQNGSSLIKEIAKKTVHFLVQLFVLFMLIWGSIQWISSGGDKQALESARGRLTGALIGIVLLFVSFALIQLIGNFFGIKILTLDIGPLVIQ